jgi:hypothetical protein
MMNRTSSVSALFFVFIALLAGGCDIDRGVSIVWPSDANVRVNIEREVTAEPDNKIVIFAKEFNQLTKPDGTQVYRFVCPCYIGEGLFNNNVAVKSDATELELSSVNDGSRYNVDYVFKSK